MGSTVVTGKKATAFKTDQGKIVYVLFEETYESNCYPHEPHWSAIHVGTIDTALQRIFSSASACEGGSLRSRSGSIKPESYFQGWMKALKNPFHFTMEEVDLKIGDGFYTPIQTKHAEEALKRLAKAGMAQDQIDLLRSGGLVKVSLDKNADFILCLQGLVLPWRIVPGYFSACDNPAPELAYNPEVKKSCPIKEVDLCDPRRLDEWILTKDHSHRWRCASQGYSLISEFVSAFYRHELEYPGSFLKSIKKLREDFKNFPEIGPDWSAFVDVGHRLHQSWKIGAIDDFGPHLQLGCPTETAHGYGFEIKPSHTQVWESLYRLFCIPAENVLWMPPKIECASMESCAQLDDSDLKQFDLF